VRSGSFTKTLHLAALLAAAACSSVEAPARRPAAAAEPVFESHLVDVGAHRLSARTAGMQHRSSGRPAVVFANGLGATLESWQLVAPRVASLATAVLYDRAGLGGSGPARAPHTVRHVAEELRALLRALGVPPPYLLVGHSAGGLFVHAFAGMFPTEVAGIVHVDPTDFTMTRADMRRALAEAGGAPDALERLDRWNDRLAAGLPPAVRAELREFIRLERTDYSDVSGLGPVPDVPVFIVAAGQPGRLPDGLELPVDHDALHRALLRRRLQHYGEWARRAPQGALLFTMSSGHGIPLEEPQLVVSAIERALFPEPVRRVRRALASRGVAGAAAEYRAIRRSYPAGRVHPYQLGVIGHELLADGRAGDAIALFEANRELYPASPAAWTLLGDAYAAHRDTTRAARAYRRALRLDSQNGHARRQLAALPSRSRRDAVSRQRQRR
jgi:pimeloyl-ACP methyl ester carboxylesterase